MPPPKGFGVWFRAWVYKPPPTFLEQSKEGGGRARLPRHAPHGQVAPLGPLDGRSHFAGPQQQAVEVGAPADHLKHVVLGHHEVGEVGVGPELKLHCGACVCVGGGEGLEPGLEPHCGHGGGRTKLHCSNRGGGRGGNPKPPKL